MTIIGNRYKVLDKLGAGGMGAVYLVHDKLRNQKVALKQVLMSDDEQRLAITREFRTLSTLRHPNIVSVIEYGSHENQPYFTMDYLPQAVPFDKSVDRKIDLFIQMLQAIGYLHRRGILHRDLKPANVLVTADGVVKVLDFGLASNTSMNSKSALLVGVVGTLAYMSPEVLNEDPPTVGSDLWAVGVMLCEMLTGHHPFDISNLMKLMMSVVMGSPNLSGMDEEISIVVSRLLSRDTTERYPSALATIHALCAAAKIDLPPESQAQRESFLQAAAFVGREHEYRCLVDALKIAAVGTHQLWLIGGEAGAGKSRLLDELRIRALVNGFVVLQGQGVEGGGLPYQLWRDPARKLVLGAPMGDLTASVLKELVPDIATLLDREVVDVPALDPNANRDRLMAAILERLCALKSPVLILLEDLHWANESLDLLKLMLPHFESLPVMIVGSYRNDECPTLPNVFPYAHLLTMERLTPDAIAQLSASMIGAENATPELVKRLVKETEGNALFMVEVMRALAEEAGSLHDITHQSLPEKILAGGMVAVLKRRLEKVPEWALDTLKLAAVIGREIDLPVLKAAGVENIKDWLHACADTVLEPYQGEWRFSHDRLRDALLHDLTDLALLHEKAVLALEAVYPDDVDYAEAMREHWHIAGNAEREVHYILKAAQHLVEISGDYTRAEKLVERGLDLNLPDTRAQLLLWKAFAAEKQGLYDTALEIYLTALDAAPAPIIQASLLNRCGRVCHFQDQQVEANLYAQQAREIAEQYDDRRNIALSLTTLGLMMKSQGDYRTAYLYLEDSLRIRREIGDQSGIAANLNSLGIVASNQGNYGAAYAYYEDSLHIKREIGDRMGIAISLNSLGNLAVLQGDYGAAHAYYEDSLHIKREIGDRWGIALSLNNLGVVMQSQGEYDASHGYHETSLHIKREIGDRRGIGISLRNLGCVTDLQGDQAAAHRLYEESLMIAREVGSPENVVYAAAGLVMIQCADARERLIEAINAARKMDTPKVLLLALLAAAHWTQNHEQTAAWIGLMLGQGSFELKGDGRLKRLSVELRGAMGDEAFDAAIERGKTLDVRTVIDDLLRELTGS